MERIETCKVYAHKRNLYYIQLTKSDKCAACKACGFGKKNRLILPALSQIDCAVGDSVAVSMPTAQVKGSYVYLYLLPLLCLFAGLMIPYGQGEKLMLLGAGIGLAIGLALVYGIERIFRRRKKYLPIILQKISQSEEKQYD